MQVFKLFFKIAKKRVLSAAIYLGIFTVLLVFMSMNAIDTNEKNFTVSSIRMTIIDRDNSQTSKALKQYLSDYHGQDSGQIGCPERRIYVLYV